MKIIENTFSVISKDRNQMIDITHQVDSIVGESALLVAMS
jgi:thiamine phosphate synthase YjbQ (UPF0047 family)